MKHIQGGQLNILMSKDEKEFFAHCLDFNLIADGKTPNEAVQRLSEMIYEYIDFFIKTNKLQDVYDPAPQEYWDVIRYLSESGKQPKEGFIAIPHLPMEIVTSPSPSRIRKHMYVVTPTSHTSNLAHA